MFEPDAVLLSSAKPNALDPTPNASSSPLALTPLPPAASADLEVEVLRQLNQANALLGEQISLNRTAEGLLRVQGGKAELLRALGSFRNNPAIATTRLFALGVANDEAARRSFSLYAANPGTAPVKTQQFWHSLKTAEALAAKISKQ